MSDYYALISQDLEIIKSKCWEWELSEKEVGLLEEAWEKLELCRVSIGKRAFIDE